MPNEIDNLQKNIKQLQKNDKLYLLELKQKPHITSFDTFDNGELIGKICLTLLVKLTKQSK